MAKSVAPQFVYCPYINYFVEGLEYPPTYEGKQYAQQYAARPEVIRTIAEVRHSFRMVMPCEGLTPRDLLIAADSFERSEAFGRVRDLTMAIGLRLESRGKLVDTEINFQAEPADWSEALVINRGEASYCSLSIYDVSKTFALEDEELLLETLQDFVDEKLLGSLSMFLNSSANPRAGGLGYAIGKLKHEKVTVQKFIAHRREQIAVLRSR